MKARRLKSHNRRIEWRGTRDLFLVSSFLIRSFFFGLFRLFRRFDFALVDSIFVLFIVYLWVCEWRTMHNRWSLSVAMPFIRFSFFGELLSFFRCCCSVGSFKRTWNEKSLNNTNRQMADKTTNRQTHQIGLMWKEKSFVLMSSLLLLFV